MRPCSNQTRLTAYLVGELPEREAAEVAAHLETCPDCRATADRLRETLARLRETLAGEAAQMPRLDPERRRALLAVRPERPRNRVSVWLFAAHPRLRAAAAILVIGSVLVVLVPALFLPAGSSRYLRVVAARSDGQSKMMCEVACKSVCDQLAESPAEEPQEASKAVVLEEAGNGVSGARFEDESVLQQEAQQYAVSPALPPASPAPPPIRGVAGKIDGRVGMGRASGDRLKADKKPEMAHEAIVSEKEANGGRERTAAAESIELSFPSVPPPTPVVTAPAACAAPVSEAASTKSATVPLAIEIPKPQFTGTPRDIRSSNLERPGERAGEILAANRRLRERGDVSKDGVVSHAVAASGSESSLKSDSGGGTAYYQKLEASSAGEKGAEKKMARDAYAFGLADQAQAVTEVPALTTAPSAAPQGGVSVTRMAGKKIAADLMKQTATAGDIAADADGDARLGRVAEKKKEARDAESSCLDYKRQEASDASSAVVDSQKSPAVRNLPLEKGRPVNLFRADDAPRKAQEPAKPAAFHPFVDTVSQPFSTFAMDVDTASYTLTRQAIRVGTWPEPERVRTEEFVNAFDYGDVAPERAVFRISQDGAQAPFSPGNHLLRIGVKGRRLGREEQRPAMLTFVIDVSGSMSQPDRIGLAQTALRLLVEQLGPRDRIQMVAYSDHAQVVLETVPASQKEAVLAAFARLQCNGSTNLEEGLRKAYELAARGFVPGAENRVILISDGVANLGADSASEILEKIAAFRKQGISCSVFGVGSGTYNDRMLEELADKGDGVYRFLDSEQEARAAFVEDLAATLNTIAKDAKIQVEWNSAAVRQYRQLGYENRALSKEQFRDDTVDAGEVGSGQSVSALYELALAPDVTPETRLGTVRIRYQRTDTGRVEEMEAELTAASVLRPASAATPSFRVAACAAAFAERLRGNPYALKNVRYDDVAAVLRPAALALSLDTRVKELLELVSAAAAMQR